METPPLVSEEVTFQRYGQVLDRVVKYPDGREIKFDVWFKNWRNDGEFVQVFPFFTESQTVTMIREFAPASMSLIWGIPGGNVERKFGSVLENAQRELSEEAGLCGGTWIPLLDDGRSILQDKYQQDRLHIFLCIDPEEDPSGGRHDVEELIEVKPGVPMAEMRSFIRSGEIQASNVAGCMLAMDKLRELGHLK